MEPGRGRAGHRRRLQVGGVGDVDAGVDAVRDRVVVVHDVVEVVDGETAVGAGFAVDAGLEVFAGGVGFVSAAAGKEAGSV